MNINSKQLNENVYQSRGDYEGHKKKKKKSSTTVHPHAFQIHVEGILFAT